MGGDIVLWMLGLLLLLIFLGVHIGVALAVCSGLGVWLMLGSFEAAVSILGNTAYEAIRKDVFAVIPLFVLMGDFISRSGAAADLYLIADGKTVATLHLKDTVKPGAADTIQWLKHRGFVPVLLSGDKENKCREVADMVGIDQVHAGQLPDEKLAVIDGYQQQGKTIMVGDGINDAPALAKADVGISLSNATQIAIDSSRIVLLHGDIASIPEALQITQQTVQTIRQNLFWAFFYNVLAIPVAAVGLLSPMIAALSMAFSDVIVVGNSIRLKYRTLR